MSEARYSKSTDAFVKSRSGTFALSLRPDPTQEDESTTSPRIIHKLV